MQPLDLSCWRWLLRVLWTARRSTQSILKETNHKYSLEGLRLKLKPSTLAKGLMRKDWHATLSWNIIGSDVGKTECRRKRRQQKLSWLDKLESLESTKSEPSVGDRERQGSLECCCPWCCRVGTCQSVGKQQQVCFTYVGVFWTWNMEVSISL